MGDIMNIDDFNEAIDWQASHAEQNGAPCTARVIRALPSVAAGDTQTGQRMAHWPGLSLKDAMPLRIAGGLHSLVLTGKDQRLGAVYRGELTDQDEITRLVCDLVERFDEELLPWLDGPPQTNEAGRSASIMAGLMWLSGRLGPDFALFELGASAGVNTMMDRYRYDLGGAVIGVEGSPMHIAPEWRGPPPPDNPVNITAIFGCDRQPIDLTDPKEALMLRSYVWPDAPARMERIDAAIALASRRAPQVAKQDAVDFVRAMLAQDQPAGVTRTLFHSIMWQYMPKSSQQAITDAMEAAGARATSERPLAWVALETDPETFRHELRVRYWPGREGAASDPVLLGFAHPHGAWVEWRGA